MTGKVIIDHSLLIPAWFAFALLHSLFASNWIKQRWQGHFSQPHHYRMAYNLFALLSLGALLWLTSLVEALPLWQWPTAIKPLSWALSAIALILFWWTCRYYDMPAFLGLRAESTTNFTLSPLHRYVRHPWYSCALLFIWSQDMDSVRLLNAVMITLYFIIGSKLEERRLVASMGDSYEEYCKRVPALVPRPWRFLAKRDVDRLG